MLKRLKITIANWCLRHLYCVILDTDFLKVRGKTIVRGTQALSEGEVNNLSYEAKSMLKFPLYTYMLNDMKNSANEMMYNKSKTVEDMLFSKAVLYTIDVLDKKIRNIAEL